MAGVLDALNPTTIANYARGAWDGVSINSWAVQALKQAGSFQFDVGGDSLSGPIEAGRYQPTITAPGQDLSSLFTPKVRHARWNFAWGELTNALVIDKGLLRRNSGDQALVRLKDTEIPALYRDTFVGTNGFVWQMYQQDGGAYTGSGLPFYGLPSFLASSSNSAANCLGWNSGTKASTGSAPAATDREIHWTSRTYGGLSLAPSGLTGMDNAQYDAYMPVMVNQTSSAWTGSAPGTGNTAIEVALQHLITRLSRFGTNDPSLMPKFAVLDSEYYRLLGERKAAREQIFVNVDNRKTADTETGFEPIRGLFHAGAFWRWDELMPARTGYAGAPSKATFYTQPLYSALEASPLSVRGDDAGIIESVLEEDPLRRQYLLSATVPGQFVFQPRYWGRIGDYA